VTEGHNERDAEVHARGGKNMAEPEVRNASQPVEVVCLSGELPFVAQGKVARAADSHYVIDTDRDAGGVPLGARVILSFPDDRMPRIIGKVTRVRDNRIECTFEVSRDRERREFPRLVAGLPTRFRVVSGAEVVREIDDWLAGRTGPASRGTWHTPDELMNFSVTGLRFDYLPVCEQDDLLLVEFGIRGQQERWRCTARVIRTWPIPPEESEGSETATHRIAINFEQIPGEAQNALSEMTLDIQEALL